MAGLNQAGSDALAEGDAEERRVVALGRVVDPEDTGMPKTDEAVA